MSGAGRQVAIAAVTELPPGRYPELDEMGLARRLLTEFFREWGVRPADIDGLLAIPHGAASGEHADIFTHEKLYDELGLHPVFSETVHAGGATHALVIDRARMAILEGRVDGVLCIASGKFPRQGTGGAEGLARLVSHPEFEFIYGGSIPAFYALSATRYLLEFGITRAQLAQVAVSAREWAMLHPTALMRRKGPLTAAQVLESRPIASPFQLLDCSVPCEGGVALLVTTEERARRFTPHPVRVLGTGEYHSHAYVSQAPSLTTTGAVHSGRAAFAMAGLTPKDVDLLCLYDAFTVCPLLLLEDLGFCGRGGAGRFVEEQGIGPKGALPVNTNGGLLSFGHTGDASGMSLLAEAVLQLMGRAGDRQVEASTALVHCFGGVMSEHATLLLGRTA